jgi:NADPH:quinone reductase-like Zn-dependent oxidoreductase
MRRMASREEAHTDQTTPNLPAQMRADVSELLNARLADSMDLILVHDAAGGVGVFAVQLARWRGPL